MGLTLSCRGSGRLHRCTVWSAVFLVCCFCKGRRKSAHRAPHSPPFGRLICSVGQKPSSAGRGNFQTRGPKVRGDLH